MEPWAWWVVGGVLVYVVGMWLSHRLYCWMFVRGWVPDYTDGMSAWINPGYACFLLTWPVCVTLALPVWSIYRVWRVVSDKLVSDGEKVRLAAAEYQRLKGLEAAQLAARKEKHERGIEDLPVPSRQNGRDAASLPVPSDRAAGVGEGRG